MLKNEKINKKLTKFEKNSKYFEFRPQKINFFDFSHNFPLKIPIFLQIPQYNYRSFFQRRIRDHFVANRAVCDVTEQKKLYEEGQKQLESLKRQAIFCKLYPHNKTIVEQKIGEYSGIFGEKWTKS